MFNQLQSTSSWHFSITHRITYLSLCGYVTLQHMIRSPGWKKILILHFVPSLIITTFTWLVYEYLVVGIDFGQRHQARGTSYWRRLRQQFSHFVSQFTQSLMYWVVYTTIHAGSGSSESTPWHRAIHTVVTSTAARPFYMELRIILPQTK